MSDHPRSSDNKQYTRLKTMQASREKSGASTATSFTEKLVQLALKAYRFGKTHEGEPFAVPRKGPNIAMLFRSSRRELCAALAKECRRSLKTTPTSSALSDVLIALEGEAMDSSPDVVAIRVCETTEPASSVNCSDGSDGSDDGITTPPIRSIVLDLGTTDGTAVVIRANGWKIVRKSPALFQRSAVTGPQVLPAKSGNLSELRSLLNVDDDSWPLLVGCLVASLIPDLPHPIIMLGGEYGTGKTTACKMITSLIDPSPAIPRSQPRDEEAWSVAAAGSWCIPIDNVSYIPPWFSDALCKAVTGDAWVRRRLYTDRDLVVSSFRRVVILTSIDPGAMRGDLGDRLLLVNLEPICDKSRLEESALWEYYHAMKPRLLAGLLNAVSAALAVMPIVNPRKLPRMADFARVLAALDHACPEFTGGRAFDLFARQRGRIANEVIEAEPIGVELVNLIHERSPWQVTAADMLDELKNRGDRVNSHLPKTPRGMTALLTRLSPALRNMGISITRARSSDSQRQRLYSIEVSE